MSTSLRNYNLLNFIWRLKETTAYTITGLGAAFLPRLQLLQGCRKKTLCSEQKEQCSVVTFTRGKRMGRKRPNTWQHLWYRLCATWSDWNLPKRGRLQLANWTLLQCYSDRFSHKLHEKTNVILHSSEPLRTQSTSSHSVPLRSTAVLSFHMRLDCQSSFLPSAGQSSSCKETFTRLGTLGRDMDTQMDRCQTETCMRVGE